MIGRHISSSSKLQHSIKKIIIILYKSYLELEKRLAIVMIK